MTYVRYSDAVEEISENEQETFASIAETFRKEGEKVRENEGRAMRVSHAKSTGLLKGELVVDDNLPPELAQGLFARAARYEALVRLAQGPGELLGDAISTHRGLSLKILGVDGERLGPDTGRVQDFVLENGKAFINSNATRFLANLKGGVSNAPMLPEGVKRAVSKMSRAASSAVKAVGGEIKTLDFFGHEPFHPLAEAYFSQVPIRYGDYIAKIGVFPGEALYAALGDRKIDTAKDRDAFRAAVVDYLKDNDAEFELGVQLCTDLDDMPVEDASVEWPEEKSPYRRVATLRIPRQAAHSAARAEYFDERLSFRPAHSLAAHRPLGQVMRARLFVYKQLADWRRGANGAAKATPETLSEVPD